MTFQEKFPAPPQYLSSKNDKKDKKEGRDIEGLLPKEARFSQLKLGEDYQTISQINTANFSSKFLLKDAFLFINPEQGDIKRLVEAPHWRTISTESESTYQLPNGKKITYYVTNIKGCGYTKPTLNNENLNNYDNWLRTNEYGRIDAYGLMALSDFNDPDKDIVKKSQWLTDNGLRTELYIAYAELKKLYFKGKKYSIQKLKRMGIIPKKMSGVEFKPGIGIRVMKNNTRIEEIYKHEESHAEKLWIKALEIFNK